jgi:hypothetical protein
LPARRNQVLEDIELLNATGLREEFNLWIRDSSGDTAASATL